jgi:hypothetical protein
LLDQSLTGFDRGCVKALKAVVSTQQVNQSCGLGESFMHELRSIRINLAARQHVKWFSHSLDPKRTLVEGHSDEDGKSVNVKEMPSAVLTRHRGIVHVPLREDRTLVVQ